MRLAIYEHAGVTRLGRVTDGGVVAVDSPFTGGVALKQLIADAVGPTIPLDAVRLLPPLAHPAKILCSLRVTFKPEAAEEAEQLHVFLKGPGSTVGDGGTVILPQLPGADVYTHNLCLAVVIGRTCRAVPAADWRDVVFGYTAMVDITGRTAELSRWKDGKSSLGSSCDTFGPLGPWIVSREEFEAQDIALELRVNGELRQQARVADLDEQIGRTIALASTVMTLHPGDVVAIEATAEGQAPLQDGDELHVDLGPLGRLTTTVRDPSGRTWDPTIRVHRDADSFDGRLPIVGHR